MRQDYEGAADAYTALLPRAPAGEGPGIAGVPPADRLAVHANRAAALLRLGRCDAAAADCDAALALLLPRMPCHPACPAPEPGGPLTVAAVAALAQAACLTSEPRDPPRVAAAAAPGEHAPEVVPSGGTAVAPQEGTTPECREVISCDPADVAAGLKRGGVAANGSAAVPWTLPDAQEWIHALAACTRQADHPGTGQAEGGSSGADAKFPGLKHGGSGEDKGLAGYAARAGDGGDWALGGRKCAMLLRLLVRRGSAHAYAKRCAAEACACAHLYL